MISKGGGGGSFSKGGVFLRGGCFSKGGVFLGGAFSKGGIFLGVKFQNKEFLSKFQRSNINKKFLHMQLLIILFLLIIKTSLFIIKTILLTKKHRISEKFGFFHRL